ncbi:DDE-type integrase/transposase/recombinase, partial [Crenobacter sp. SG2305]|uniref:DDE-type integrase/transposase/recombinase n=1 Tax=Crenobacter oryzisoli TaxID=3056844 RepID=UPI0025AB1E4B
MDAINAERGKLILVRQIKYLNNVIEQDHRTVKWRTRPMLRFKNFWTARRILIGIEIMHAIQKGQLERESAGLTPAEQFYGLVA